MKIIGKEVRGLHGRLKRVCTRSVAEDGAAAPVDGAAGARVRVLGVAVAVGGVAEAEQATDALAEGLAAAAHVPAVAAAAVVRGGVEGDGLARPGRALWEGEEVG